MRAAVDAGHVVFTDEAGDFADVFVDADLLPASGEVEIDAVKADSAADAARLYAARAETLAGLLHGIDGPVEVVGSGITASLLRSLLPSLPGEDGPGAIVELTGDPETVADAMRRLRDLGTLVLAGSSGGRPLDLDLYPDVHVRGLRLLGAPLGVAFDAASQVGIELEPPATARLGQPAGLGPSWYQVSDRAT